MELCHQFRPKRYKDIIGQDIAVKQLRKWSIAKRLPRALLFHGPTGCGKTTAARITAGLLTKYGTVELNCASMEPMKVIRALEREAGFKTLTGEPRVWILDEFQSLSRATKAQEGCLKLFEDSMNAYFFLCSSEPNRIITAIRNRCSSLPFKLVSDNDIEELLTKIVNRIKVVIKDTTIEKIVEVAEGSPRKALVILDQVYLLDNESDQLKAIDTLAVSETEIIELARILCNGVPTWKEAAGIIKGLEGQDAETVRHIILGYAQAIILNCAKIPKKASRARAVIESFRELTYGDMAVICAMTHAICR